MEPSHTNGCSSPLIHGNGLNSSGGYIESPPTSRTELPAVSHYMTKVPEVVGPLPDIPSYHANFREWEEFQQINTEKKGTILLQSPLGRGYFAKVYKGSILKEGGKTVAVKQIKVKKWTPARQTEIKKEYDIIRRLRHRNVVQYITQAFDKHYYFLVLQYVARGSLQSVLVQHGESLPLQRRLMFAKDVANGIMYIHKSEPPIIHYDLRACNILVDDDWKCLVADFGVSHILRNGEIENREPVQAVLPWIAPEVYEGRGSTVAADVFSYGTLLWEIFASGRDLNSPQYQPMITDPDVNFTDNPVIRKLRLPDKCPEPVASLMRVCWSSDPSLRPNFSQVLDELDRLLQLLVGLPPQLSLIEAAQRGKLDAMRLRLQEAPNEVNAGDEYGTPLFWAVRNGYVSEIRELLAKGASIHASLALHVASQQRSPLHVEIARTLLEQTTDLDARDADGRAPLHVACITGNKEVAQLLIARGANINAQDTYGETPLHLSARNGRTDLVSLLLAQPAIQVNLTEKEERIPLHWSAINGHYEISKILIEHGSHIDKQHTFGRTPLFYATKNNHKDVVSLLLQHGAKLSIRDKVGRVALHLAAAGGHRSMVLLLLEAGSHINTEDFDGITPYDRAKAEHFDDLAELLASMGGKPGGASKKRPMLESNDNFG